MVNWKVESELINLLVPTVRLTVVVELGLTVWRDGIFVNCEAPLQNVAISISPGELPLYDTQVCSIAIAKLQFHRQREARGELDNSAILHSFVNVRDIPISHSEGQELVACFVGAQQTCCEEVAAMKC